MLLVLLVLPEGNLVPYFCCTLKPAEQSQVHTSIQTGGPSSKSLLAHGDLQPFQEQRPRVFLRTATEQRPLASDRG